MKCSGDVTKILRGPFILTHPLRVDTLENVQINSCKTYFRQRLKDISDRQCLKQPLLRRSSETNEENYIIQAAQKKRKRLGEEYQSGNLSDEYGETEDEVDKYLSMHIDQTSIVDNPLVFGKKNQNNFPLLSKLARKVHSIPATTAAVERQFSADALLVTENWSSLHPDNVDNVLFLRSVARTVF